MNRPPVDGGILLDMRIFVGDGTCQKKSAHSAWSSIVSKLSTTISVSWPSSADSALFLSSVTLSEET